MTDTKINTKINTEQLLAELLLKENKRKEKHREAMRKYIDSKKSRLGIDEYHKQRCEYKKIWRKNKKQIEEDSKTKTIS